MSLIMNQDYLNKILKSILWVSIDILLSYSQLIIKAHCMGFMIILFLYFIKKYIYNMKLHQYCIKILSIKHKGS